MATIIEAILAINPSAKVSLADEDVSQITWQDGTSPIFDEDILAKKAELQAEYDAEQYARNRQEEYPTWQDQLDDIYHNGIDGWKTTIKVTKDKYPKG